MVRLNGRRGRWPEARDRYREEQAQKVQEKLALEEDRLRDWQIIKRRQAGIDGLNWFVKAVSNLRDDASPESIAKLGGLMDRMLSSVTGLAPVEGAPGGAGVSVNVQTNTFNAGAFAPNSPQAKLSCRMGKKVGETDDDHTRRLAYTIRDLYIECDRAGLYDDLKLELGNSASGAAARPTRNCIRRGIAMVTVLTPQTVIGTPAPVRIEDGLRKWRIQRTIDDPFEFGRIYFPKYWFQKSPAFHEEIMNLAINKSKEDHSNKNLNTLVIAARETIVKAL
jgi:hypothetical protein